MNFIKPKRIVDIKLLEAYRNRPCDVCWKYPPNDPDHICTRGAKGNDEESNLWTLCRCCHTERHAIGLTTFVNYHLHLQHILLSKGWYYEDYLKRWIRNMHSTS